MGGQKASLEEIAISMTSTLMATEMMSGGLDFRSETQQKSEITVSVLHVRASKYFKNIVLNITSNTPQAHCSVQSSMYSSLLRYLVGFGRKVREHGM